MEDDKGYLIYKNIRTGKECYNHPKFSAIMSHLEVEFSSYKFTIYRCALKIVTLQKVFFTHSTPYKLVLSVLERHQFAHAGDSSQIYPSQLTSIIHDVFFACDKLGHFMQSSSFELETATGVLANFFWNTFDPQRSNPISLLEIKVVFLVFCEVNSLDQTISEYFSLCADHNRCISRYRLETLLRILTKILSFIGESDSYGAQNIPVIIDQCFAQCPGINGLNEYQFNCLWTTSQTRFLIYANLLALVKRIKDAEKLVHNIQCTSCLCEKIVGIRFKCVNCRNISLCMRCFVIGYENGKHNATHKMYEVFSDAVPRRRFTHILAKLCNIFFIGRTHLPKGTSNDDTKNFVENDTELTVVENKGSEENIKEGTKASKRDSLQDELPGSSSQSSGIVSLDMIIEKLHAESEKLENQRLMLEKQSDSRTVCQFLENHKQVLLNIIGELNHLMQHSSILRYPTSSTPNRLSFDKGCPEISNLSKSINGAEVNKSYLEANKSDYTINDLSTWFHHKHGEVLKTRVLSTLNESDYYETQLTNFCGLLAKVKEIVEDSYSDNSQLAEATHHLEKALDAIIREEEIKRKDNGV